MSPFLTGVSNSRDLSFELLATEYLDDQMLRSRVGGLVSCIAVWNSILSGHRAVPKSFAKTGELENRVSEIEYRRDLARQLLIGTCEELDRRGIPLSEKTRRARQSA